MAVSFPIFLPFSESYSESLIPLKMGPNSKRTAPPRLASVLEIPSPAAFVIASIRPYKLQFTHTAATALALSEATSR
jgi:hypothetical protein